MEKQYGLAFALESQKQRKEAKALRTKRRKKFDTKLPANALRVHHEALKKLKNDICERELARVKKELYDARISWNAYELNTRQSLIQYASLRETWKKYAIDSKRAFINMKKQL